MKRYVNIFVIAFGVLCFSVSLYLIADHKTQLHFADDPVASILVNLDDPIEIKKIIVINGGEFDVFLDNNERIYVTLGVRTTPEASSEVIKFLNRITNARLVKRSQLDNGSWLVYIYVTVENSDHQLVEVELSSWLQNHGLIYND